MVNTLFSHIFRQTRHTTWKQTRDGRRQQTTIAKTTHTLYRIDHYSYIIRTLHRKPFYFESTLNLHSRGIQSSTYFK